MKTNNRFGIGALLMAMLLMSMVFVSAAAAVEDVKKIDSNSNEEILIKGQEVKEEIDEKYANGMGDSKILTYSPSGSLMDTKSTVEWTANTDLYNYYLSPAPRLKTYSKSRGDSSAFDIDEISVRGRVWKNGDIIFDDTDTNSDSADASIYWKYGCTFCAGDYTAKGNHVFEYGATSWYPTTSDSLD